MLLSSLCLQTAVLHGRRLQSNREVLLRQDDQLASAAHAMSAALSGSYHCLLTVPSSQWERGELPSDCPSGLDPTRLPQELKQEHSVELSSWMPVEGGGLLRLQLASSGREKEWSLQLHAGGLREVHS